MEVLLVLVLVLINVFLFYYLIELFRYKWLPMQLFCFLAIIAIRGTWNWCSLPRVTSQGPVHQRTGLLRALFSLLPFAHEVGRLGDHLFVDARALVGDFQFLAPPLLKERDRDRV